MGMLKYLKKEVFIYFYQIGLFYMNKLVTVVAYAPKAVRG